MLCIAIEIYRHASVKDALLATSKSMYQGYGAGGLTTPTKNRNYFDEDYLGFWTACPESWDGLEGAQINMHITFPNIKELYMASSAVRNLADTFNGEESGNVVDTFDGVVGTFTYKKA